MKAYSIDYSFKGMKRTASVDAKDVNSAKNKIARKCRCSANDIKIEKVTVVGYF